MRGFSPFLHRKAPSLCNLDFPSIDSTSCPQNCRGYSLLVQEPIEGPLSRGFPLVSPDFHESINHTPCELTLSLFWLIIPPIASPLQYLLSFVKFGIIDKNGFAISIYEELSKAHPFNGGVVMTSIPGPCGEEDERLIANICGAMGRHGGHITNCSGLHW